MVLFLVVMGVALLAITKNVAQRESLEETQHRDIEQIFERLSQSTARHEGIRIDRTRRVIDFGDRARFAFGKSSLAVEQETVLRQFVPEIIELANSSLGRRVLKRVVVEGYADRTGSYLSNLNLSLQRSQRVLCAMFATHGNNLLSDIDKQSVRDLFLVGGFSYNSSKASDEESRRVEMRLEFLGLGEERAAMAADAGNFGECALR
jgi:flagellar motor protein MotB